MERTGKPTVAGVFMIVNGGLNVIGLVVILIGLAVATPILDTSPGFDIARMGAFFLFMAFVGVVFSAVSIVGGIYALKRKLWGLALAGSIVAVLQMFILGVPALVLLVMSREEFE